MSIHGTFTFHILLQKSEYYITKFLIFFAHLEQFFKTEKGEILFSITIMHTLLQTEKVVTPNKKCIYEMCFLCHCTFKVPIFLFNFFFSTNITMSMNIGKFCILLLLWTYVAFEILWGNVSYIFQYRSTSPYLVNYTRCMMYRMWNTIVFTILHNFSPFLPKGEHLALRHQKFYNWNRTNCASRYSTCTVI